VKFNPCVHHRRSVRLPSYNYAQDGAYFVTICTYNKECIFDDDELRATAASVWQTVAPTAGGAVDEFVVMPNHLHGIIWIADRYAVGAQQPQGVPSVHFLDSQCRSNLDHPVAAPLQRFAVVPRSLGAIVRAFKSATAKRINNIRRTPGAPLWQRNYYEHIIRDEDDLLRIREYILDNPRKWAEDPDKPVNLRT
jgi:REP-associated tyrosine transposase